MKKSGFICYTAEIKPVRKKEFFFIVAVPTHSYVVVDIYIYIRTHETVNNRARKGSKCVVAKNFSTSSNPRSLNAFFLLSRLSFVVLDSSEK